MRPSLFRLWSLWNSALTLPSCEIPDLLTWWWNRKTFLDTFCTLLYQCRWVQLPSFQWNFAISQLWQCWRSATGSQALRFNHKVKLLLHPHCQKWPDNRKIEVKNRNTEVFDVNFGILVFRYFDITPSTESTESTTLEISTDLQGLLRLGAVEAHGLPETSAKRSPERNHQVKPF